MTPGSTYLDAPVLSLEDARQALSCQPEADLIPARLRYVDPVPEDLRTPHGFTYADRPDHPLLRAGFQSSGWNTGHSVTAYDRAWHATEQNLRVSLHDTAEDWMRYANHPAWGAAYLEVLDPADDRRALSLPLPLHLVSVDLIREQVARAARHFSGEDNRPVHHRTTSSSTAWVPREIKYAPLRAACTNLKRAGIAVRRVTTSAPDEEFTVAFDRLGDEVMQAAVNAGFDVDLSGASICTLAPAHLQAATNAAALRLLADLAAGTVDVTGQAYRVPWTTPTQVDATFTEIYL